MKWFHKKSFFSQLRASLRGIFDKFSFFLEKKKMQYNCPNVGVGGVKVCSDVVKHPFCSHS